MGSVLPSIWSYIGVLSLPSTPVLDMPRVVGYGYSGLLMSTDPRLEITGRAQQQADVRGLDAIFSISSSPSQMKPEVLRRLCLVF